MLLTAVAVRAGGDRWGWATLIAYGPRAAVLVPGVAVLPTAAWGWARRGRRPWASAAAVVLAWVGVLDANVPWRSLPRPSPSPTLRVLELNANGGGTDAEPYDPARLAALVAAERPDVLVLAEWADRAVPPGGPWDARQVGDVRVASRFPIGRTASWSAGPLGGEGTVVACELAAPGGPVWCVGLHLETPRRGFEPVLRRQPGAWRLLAESIARRRRLADAAAAFVRATTGGGDAIVAGDFNLVPDGAIFGRAWGGWDDAFARAGWGSGWTKWQWGWGTRIDHVLTGDRSRAARCRVGPDVGSDHLPLIADLAVAR